MDLIISFRCHFQFLEIHALLFEHSTFSTYHSPVFYFELLHTTVYINRPACCVRFVHAHALLRAAELPDQATTIKSRAITDFGAGGDN